MLMVGDGINDSPALSEADAGIAVSGGAAIAQEIADITIPGASLWELTELRRIAMGLMRRIHANYRFVIGFNGGLIALGVAGALTPAARHPAQPVHPWQSACAVCASLPAERAGKSGHISERCPIGFQQKRQFFPSLLHHIVLFIQLHATNSLCYNLTTMCSARGMVSPIGAAHFPACG